MSRAFILLLDSFGLGALPDADKYGDTGANTLGHIAEWAAKQGKPMSLPNLEAIGLGAAAHKASGEWPAGFDKRDGFTGAWGVAREQLDRQGHAERPLGNRRRAGAVRLGLLPEDRADASRKS